MKSVQARMKARMGRLVISPPPEVEVKPVRSGLGAVQSVSKQPEVREGPLEAALQEQESGLALEQAALEVVQRAEVVQLEILMRIVVKVRLAA